MCAVRKVNLPSLPEWQEPAERETIELELRLITPMFGGGYKAREVDTVQPIRPAAIRGHLRFWWRATAGARYATVEELHKAERELWGAAATKDNPAVGKVAIQVQTRSPGEKVLYNQVRDRRAIVDYRVSYRLWRPLRGNLTRQT